MNEVISAISTVGFPIVMVGAMAYYVKYITDENRKQLDRQNEAHTKEMQQVTEALNNNTLALTKLCERMDRN